MTAAETQHIRALLTEAVKVLCKNGLSYNVGFSIEGLIGITLLDDNQVTLISIHETVMNRPTSESDPNADKHAQAQKSYTHAPTHVLEAKKPINVTPLGYADKDKVMHSSNLKTDYNMQPPEKPHVDSVSHNMSTSSIPYYPLSVQTEHNQSYLGESSQPPPGANTSPITLPYLNSSLMQYSGMQATSTPNDASSIKKTASNWGQNTENDPPHHSRMKTPPGSDSRPVKKELKSPGSASVGHRDDVYSQTAALTPSSSNNQYPYTWQQDSNAMRMMASPNTNKTPQQQHNSSKSTNSDQSDESMMYESQLNYSLDTSSENVSPTKMDYRRRMRQLHPEKWAEQKRKHAERMRLQRRTWSKEKLEAERQKSRDRMRQKRQMMRQLMHPGDAEGQNLMQAHDPNATAAAQLIQHSRPNTTNAE